MTMSATSFSMTPADAASQWLRVLQRDLPAKGKRQENYLPVEVVTALALLTVVDPRQQGWNKYDPQLEQIATLCRRSPGSIAEKERNLDGSRPNAGAGERDLFRVVAADPWRFFELWAPVVEGARRVGIGPDRLPDLLDLGAGDFQGQESLVGDWASHLGEEVEQFLANGLDGQTAEQAAITMARVGQHRFARRVRVAYASRCGFCGLDASRLPRSRLLIASHIKPWRNSSATERGDVRNGIAACPSHDAAFDAGLLTVTGDGRIFSAALLRDASDADPAVSASLSRSIREGLLSPADASESPGADYLEWHHTNIWRNGVGALSTTRRLRAAGEARGDYQPDGPD